MTGFIAKILRKQTTDAERFLWKRLRRRQIHGFKFRRRVPIGPYVVDFACLEAKVAIELDGGQHAQQEQYDFARTAWLQSQEFRVVRFWNNQVFQETDAVLRKIEEVLLSDHPHPNPPPQGGRGCKCYAL